MQQSKTGCKFRKKIGKYLFYTLVFGFKKWKILFKFHMFEGMLYILENIIFINL